MSFVGEEQSSEEQLLLERQKLTMLSETQLSRLNDILNNKVTKKEVEIVISRSYEDISWSNMYSNIRTIYDKYDPITITTTLPFNQPPTEKEDAKESKESEEGENDKEESPKSLRSNTIGYLSKRKVKGDVIRLENVGRESFTYLHHIITNYNSSLADLTIFTHGSMPTHGYEGHRLGGGHLISNSTFHDFVLTTSKDGHFIFTGAIYLPTLSHILRSGYNKRELNRKQGMMSCPSPPLYETGGSEYKFDLDDRAHISVMRHIASLCRQEKSPYCSGLAFWNKFIRLKIPIHQTIFFTQGALFAVTREQIKRRPYEDYKQLYDEVSKSVDPSAGFFLEWFWYYLLTSPDIITSYGPDVDSYNLTMDSIWNGHPIKSVCEVNGKEFVWSMDRPYYRSMDLTVRDMLTKSVKSKVKKSKKRDKRTT
eukprot:gene5491-7603_t